MAAAALDAADGVMDGRHFGRPIVQAGPQFGGFAQPAFGGFAQPVQSFGGFAQPVQSFGGFAQPVQSFGGFAQPVQSFGTTFGATQFPATFGAQQFIGAPTQFVGGASSTAAALDAADGVIDGRHFGRPIVQAGAPVGFGGASFVQRPTIVGGPVFGGAPQFGATQFVGAPTFGAQQFIGAPQFGATQFIGGASSTAAALDAADGVLDGRHFGRPIVQAGAAPIASYGTAFGAPAFGGIQQFGAAPVQFAGATQFGGFPVGQQFGGFPQAFGGQSRAAQLDAADGVIDGRFYGRPIVQRR